MFERAIFAWWGRTLERVGIDIGTPEDIKSLTGVDNLRCMGATHDG
jgi:hypothetical protein